MFDEVVDVDYNDIVEVYVHRSNYITKTHIETPLYLQTQTRS